MTFACALLLFSVLDGATVPGPLVSAAPLAFAAGDAQKDKEGDQALTRYLQASKQRIVRGVSMAAHFAGRLPKMKKSATVEARRKITRDGTVAYEVNERSGDTTVWKELILRYMNGEMESSGKDNKKVALTPDNYKFKYKGQRERDGRQAYVFEVNPRKKREGLFRGEVWVDADTALTVLEAGRFVKSPSVFLKKVEFTREYSILDGVAVPKAMQTSIETRFWGKAELDIQYTEFCWEEPLSAN